MTQLRIGLKREWEEGREWGFEFIFFLNLIFKKAELYVSLQFLTSEQMMKENLVLVEQGNRENVKDYSYRKESSNLGEYSYEKTVPHSSAMEKWIDSKYQMYS